MNWPDLVQLANFVCSGALLLVAVRVERRFTALETQMLFVLRHLGFSK